MAGVAVVDGNHASGIVAGSMSRRCCSVLLALRTSALGTWLWQQKWRGRRAMGTTHGSCSDRCRQRLSWWWRGAVLGSSGG
jgi:hypothetical protein